MIAGAPGSFVRSTIASGSREATPSPWAQSGRNWMKIAPTTRPESPPRPPTTTPTRRKIESAIGKVSGLTNVVAMAKSDPATPA